MTDNFSAVRYKNDGLELYARDYGNPDAKELPALCLPGLTRNSKDFHELASELAHTRRVICPDFRGRGLSAYARKADAYTPITELQDTLKLLDKLSIERVVPIGTSRGGLVTMVMAQVAPDRLAGAVLNDVGPRIEAEGIRRIAGYAGTMAVPDSWEELAQALKAANTPAFQMSDDQWLAFARQTFADNNGKPRMDYDPKIGDALRAGTDPDNLPEMWDSFDALKAFPLLVIRGANSDLLSAETVDEMAERHGNCQTVTVADRGHAPLLNEPECVAAIDAFLQRCDANA